MVLVFFRCAACCLLLVLVLCCARSDGWYYLLRCTVFPLIIFGHFFFNRRGTKSNLPHTQVLVLKNTPNILLLQKSVLHMYEYV